MRMRLPWRPKRGTTAATAPWTLPYADTATSDDVLACFRLLLGRMPNAEEWRGHSMRVGEPLARVVASYLTSLEFERRGLLAPQSDSSIVAADVQGFVIYSSLDDSAVGKHVRADNYEREVTAVFRSIVEPGMSVVDIGANIGYFTMLAASLVGSAGRVLAVEPNPRNVRMLEASRRANGFDRVTIAQTAAGRETGLLLLNTSYSNGTTSDLPADLQALFGAQAVPGIRLDSLLDRDAQVDVIKIDVEGAEYNALLGAEATLRRCRPLLISEFSPSLMPGISNITGEDYLRWLTGLGYALAVIEADGSLTETGSDINAVMAIYRSRMSDHIDILARPT